MASENVGYLLSAPKSKMPGVEDLNNDGRIDMSEVVAQVESTTPGALEYHINNHLVPMIEDEDRERVVGQLQRMIDGDYAGTQLGGKVPRWTQSNNSGDTLGPFNGCRMLDGLDDDFPHELYTQNMLDKGYGVAISDFYSNVIKLVNASDSGVTISETQIYTPLEQHWGIVGECIVGNALKVLGIAAGAGAFGSDAAVVVQDLPPLPSTGGVGGATTF